MHSSSWTYSVSDKCDTIYYNMLWDDKLVSVLADDFQCRHQNRSLGRLFNAKLYRYLKVCSYNNFFFLFDFVAETQRETKHISHFGDESMARSQTEGHWRMGWRRPSCSQFVALWRTCCRYHHQWQRPVQVWNVGQISSWSRLRLGLLWIPFPHPLFGQIR